MPDPGQAHDIVGLMRSIAAASRRHIPLSGTLNFRDAGGYPVEGGGTVAWRTLLRSDALHRLDQTGADVLAGLGLRTVIDLRTGMELEIAPSPLDDFAERGTLTVHISLIGDDFTAVPAELDDIYSFMIDERGAAIGAAIRSLARPAALPGLVHCTAGKDRTGIVVALTLAAVGVPDRFIAADYALSSMYLDPEYTPAIGQVRAGTGLSEELTAALLASPPVLILRALDRARNTGGSIAGYLARQGVTDTDLAALRVALVSTEQRHDEGG